MSQLPFLHGTAAGSQTLDTDDYQYVTITVSGLAAQTATPTITSVVSNSTGGTLPATTNFGYRITIHTPAGETTLSAEVTTVTGLVSTNSNTINFAAPAAGTEVYIYGRTAGGPWGFLGSSTTTSFVDDGSVTPGSTVPAANTTAESVTVRIAVPDGQTPPTALDVNGNAAAFTSDGSQVFFGGPAYLITKTGTINAGIFVDFGGRVQ